MTPLFLFRTLSGFDQEYVDEVEYAVKKVTAGIETSLEPGDNLQLVEQRGRGRCKVSGGIEGARGQMYIYCIRFTLIRSPTTKVNIEYVLLDTVLIRIGYRNQQSISSLSQRQSADQVILFWLGLYNPTMKVIFAVNNKQEM